MRTIYLYRISSQAGLWIQAEIVYTTCYFTLSFSLSPCVPLLRVYRIFFLVLPRKPGKVTAAATVVIGQLDSASAFFFHQWSLNQQYYNGSNNNTNYYYCVI